MDDYYDDRAYRRHKPDQHREERDEVQFDLTKEFTCFLCNGITTCLGSVELDRGAIHFVSASGYTMETVKLKQIVSVNELEPIRGDCIFITMGLRYVLVSFLLRKEQLVQYFKDAGLYQGDIRLPPEAVGFHDPDATLVLSEEEESQVARNPQFPSAGDPTSRTAIVPSSTQHHAHHSHPQVLHSPSCPFHRGGQCPMHSAQQQQQVTIKYNFRFNNMAAMKQVHKEPHTPLPQTDTRPTVRTPQYYRTRQQTDSYTTTRTQQNDSNVVTTNTSSSPPQQKSTATKVEKPKDKTSLLKGLKMLFPSHQEESLRKALEETDYVMDDAITALLEQNELANT